MKRGSGIIHKYLFWIGFSLIFIGGLTYFVFSTTTPLLIPLVIMGGNPSRPGFVLILAGLILLIIDIWRHVKQPGYKQSIKWRGLLFTISVVIASLYYINSSVALPFYQEEVNFRNGSVELAGTLLIPQGNTPHPAVVFMHGSGPEFRWTQYPIAVYLARHGIAALIYDKRGVSASKGGHPRDSYQDLAYDALAGVHYLKDRTEIQAQQIALWGYSEGGSTAPLAASLSPDVTFLILTSAAGVTYEELVFYEVLRREQDLSVEESYRAVALRHQINEYYRTGEGYEDLIEAVQRAEGESWYKAAGMLPLGIDEICLYGSACAIEYLDGLRADPNWDFDPIPLFEGITIPMLFIFGGQDWDHPIEENMRRLQEALVEPGEKDAEILFLPEADHTIFVWTGPLLRYAPGYLETATQWLFERITTLSIEEE